MSNNDQVTSQATESSERVAVVIVAAGRSTRMAGLDKQFALAGNRPILAHTIEVFERNPQIHEIVLVLNEANIMRGRALIYEQGWSKVQRVVTGGERRQDSVWNGLQALQKNPPKWVLIHDGARPFVTDAIIADGLNSVREYGASVVGVPVKDTIKLVSAATLLVEQTPPRDLLWAVQTPQIFNFDLIVEAHQEAVRRQLDVTDDASLCEKLDRPVKIFQGTYTNIKITTPDDLELAQRIFAERPAEQSAGQPVERQTQLPDAQSVERQTETFPISAEQVATSSQPEKSSAPTLRIGQGFDVHKLVENRPLILGGQTIEFERGLAGHSDADVLTHAIINALLGAAGLGDIGRYFPPTDPIYKGIPSLKMLFEVNKLLQERQWQIVNIDATVVAQRPKLSPHTPAMRQNLAECLGIAVEQINLKAVTTEQLGFVGREEGLEAQAIAMIQRQN